MSKDYTEKDAARDTNSGGRETSRAWHSARDDAASSGELPERNWGKVSDSSAGRAIYSFITGTVSPKK